MAFASAGVPNLACCAKAAGESVRTAADAAANMNGARIIGILLVNTCTEAAYGGATSNSDAK
jgi:hypothetical protein